jgi:hypothetical protein
MKFFIVFSLFFMALSITPLNAISVTIHNSKMIGATNSPSITFPHKEIDTRVGRGKKIKLIAGGLLFIALLLAMIGPKTGFGLSIFAIASIICFLLSLILFLVGLAMQHHWN